MILTGTRSWGSNLKENMETLISIVIGAVITWFFSWLYYAKSGKQLVQEAAKLRQLNELLLRGMENAGLMKIARDESGQPTGLVIELEAHIGASSSMSAKLD
jgi:hypothetical protein